MQEAYAATVTSGTTPIILPQPPLCAPRVENLVHVGDPVIVIRRDATKINGKLLAFNNDTGSILVFDQAAGREVLLELVALKLVTLPEPHVWVRADPPQAAHNDALTCVDERQPFRIRFIDGDTLEGETWGSRPDRNGLFLFPTQSPTQFNYVFVPKSAIAEQEVGQKFGQILVEQNLVSAEDVTEALRGQQEDKSELLGEYLCAKAVVTSLELERALERQTKAPNFRLGEILVGEHLITEQQLFEALREQKKQRGMPLGEILLGMGLITKADIQRCLVKKLGIPFVDLRKFDVDMEAVHLVPEELARRYTILPLYVFEQKLVIAVDNPMDWDALDALRFHTNLYIEPVMAPEEEIRKAISVAYLKRGFDNSALEDYAATAIDGDEEADDNAWKADNIIVRLVNKIIVDAYHQRASDIHIEPGGRDAKVNIRIRRDGVLVPYYEAPAKLRRAIVSRIKVMAGLDLSERRMPQDGKILFRNFSSLKVELRVAVVPTVGGQEDVVIRLLGTGAPLRLGQLALSPNNQESIKRIINRPYGLILVTGPTGCGKTTTLHSFLARLNQSDRKVWTAEDPVEITQIGLRQLQVNPKVGLTFASAMRAFLRADPDVIMVGEMRDEETAGMAIEASLTGHLVLSTLHTNSATESVTRLLEMGVAPYIFADALLGIIAQRLVRRLCPDCCERVPTDSETLVSLAEVYNKEIVDTRASRASGKTLSTQQIKAWQEAHGDDKGRLQLGQAVGCDECDQTGFRGRVGIHEVLEMTPALHQQILGRDPAPKLLATALKGGMRTMKQDGIDKVLQGLTDLNEVMRACLR